MEGSLDDLFWSSQPVCWRKCYESTETSLRLRPRIPSLAGFRQSCTAALGAPRSRTHQQKLVGKDKLAYLLQNRKSRAIQIILNNSTYQNAPVCANNTISVQKNYTSKCVPERPEGMLNVPPWTGSLFPVQFSQLKVPLFTATEVEKVVSNLPNNKASGHDGVTYEMLKTTTQMEYPILTNIFNICLENGKVPESWKGALIHCIPKKDNTPDDPSTWRDISLLPTVYKIFMKCMLSQILTWLVEKHISIGRGWMNTSSVLKRE